MRSFLHRPSARRASAALLIALAAPALAGCIGPGGAPLPGDPALDLSSLLPGPGDTTPAAPAAHVVLGFSDTGINPYHAAFRDAGPLAHRHPSTYLRGYPADAVALELTLDAPDHASAREADAAVWDAVEPGVLYWVPGTRIVGAIQLSDPGSGGGPLGDGAEEGCPPVLDCDGHGTMVASRGAGAGMSLCDACRIVMAQSFEEGAAWLSEQAWVDLQSDSWTSLTPDPALARRMAGYAARMPVYMASGNGLLGVLGVAGMPSWISSTAGAPGVTVVGGHDNGQVVLWSGAVPHVVADACWSWAALPDSLDEAGPRVGSGTSAATPYAAGAAARFLLEARGMLGDPATGARDGGVLARGDADAAGIAAGPLADGELTREELRALVLHTADPRPRATAHDGDLCGPETTPYTTTPLAWAQVPAGVPAYYLAGYGAVNEDSLASGLEVLRGAAELPARDDVAPFPEVDHAARDALYGDGGALPGLP